MTGPDNYAPPEIVLLRVVCAATKYTFEKRNKEKISSCVIPTTSIAGVLRTIPSLCCFLHDLVKDYTNVNKKMTEGLDIKMKTKRSLWRETIYVGCGTHYSYFE